MKFLHFLPLFSICAAYVIPPEEILGDLGYEHNVQKEQDQTVEIQNPLDDVLDSTPVQTLDSDSSQGYDIQSWIDRVKDTALDYIQDAEQDDDEDEIKNGRPHLPFPLPHPHHPSSTTNQTIYQLITSSRYTTNLSAIINEDPSLVQLLNATHADYNITLFAPTDRAFAKLPPHLPRPSREFVRAVMKYHLADGVYPALDVFHRQTAPTLLNESIDGRELPQRVTLRAGWRGLKVDFYSRLVAVDIVCPTSPIYIYTRDMKLTKQKGAKNGLIHALDSILLPPPPALSLFTILPTHFSTFTLALLKTSLAPTLENASKRVTIFAPSNHAFQNLGLHLNAFLFSAHGTPYLRALLQYHIVQNRTLYSDVFYAPDGQVRELGTRGFSHLDLPTLLGEGKSKGKRGASLAVDVRRFGPYTSIKLNGFQRVAFRDALAKDGVVHILDHVLVPPRRVRGVVDENVDKNGELTVEDLKERLSDWVDDLPVVDDVDNIWDHDGEL